MVNLSVCLTCCFNKWIAVIINKVMYKPYNLYRLDFGGYEIYYTAFLIVFIILPLLVAIILLPILLSSKHRSKRFIEKWNNKANEALLYIKQVKQSQSFFADKEKDKFKKNYQRLYESYVSLKKPRKVDLREKLSIFDEFAKEYSKIDNTQLEHNVTYLTPFVKEASTILNRIKRSNQFFSDNDKDQFKRSYKKIYDL